MSKVEQYRNGVFVSPGDKLGVIEEFLHGEGTYVEDGNIYSSIAGKLFINMDTRELHILPRTHQPLIPREADIVIGEVTNVQDKTLILKILQIEDTQLSVPFTGIMHISDVSRGYVKTMNDAFKVGDIARARVISTKNREFHLSTQNDKLGVIQAVCVHCGNPLVRQRNQLRCIECGKTDRRKMTFDYGEPSNQSAKKTKIGGAK